MKKVFFVLAGLWLSASTILAEDFETATEAVKNMGVGWNMGNTLDANNGSGAKPSEDNYWGQQGLESENCWGQPNATPELVKMMKEAGFGAIRVPITWYNHMDKDGKVDAKWMARVHEIVDYIINEGLYCVINVHHDTGADGDNFNSWLKASEENYAANKDRFEGLWTQIATEFKDYDEHLLFAAYNEMLDELNSWCFASFSSKEKYDATVAASAYAAINSYAQSFVNAVRATGGNNAQRNLVLNTYGSCNGSGNWNDHLKDPLKEMKMPEGESNHIIFEVHSYPSISNLANAKKEFDQNIVDLQETLGALGAPVVYGEWGTSSNNGDGTNDYLDNRENLLDFVDYAIKAMKEAGMAGFWWMGLTDGANRSMPAFNQPELAEAMIKAYHGSTEAFTYPTTDDFQTIYTVKYNDDWSELFLFGDWSKSKKLKLSEYKGIRLEMLDDSCVSKLQVKLYGEGDKTLNLDLDGATTTINFADHESEIGSEIQMITLQTMAGALEAKVKSSTIIKADGTETPGAITVAWGCELTTESTYVSGIHTIQRQASTDGPIYNLTGQRVSKPQRGIYIQNGRKYIAK